MTVVEAVDEQGAGGFDRLVVDSAPTGHMLRLLTLPDVMSGWIEGLARARERHRDTDRMFAGMLGSDADAPDPLLARLAVPSRGLDYGCGPRPALAAMLEEAGHAVALYDPFFQPEPAPLGQRYDFVTCTEAAEHFHRPAATFEQIMGLVRPGGWLALMTCFQTDDARFANWHYRRDPTHVVFYRETTLRHLAAAHGWSCTVPAKDVALMQAPAQGSRTPAIDA